ncbi:MAG: glycosyltransferase, partial [Prevotellaceae bacterium]|nr:glycosyltransferase [Prevotellaceae bacterium]
MKKVVILMSTYNGERYLHEQIKSLLAQKGVEIDIFVRDDGSTDNTTEILKEYEKEGILRWYFNGHKNVQKSFLDLCKKAPKADYYAFCDQDDIWDDDKLLVATQALNNKSSDKPLIYYCGQRLVDVNLNLLSIHKVSNNRSDHTNFLISNVAGCTTVFNSKLLDLINSSNPDFILMHDSWIFKVCLAMNGEYVVDPEPHISYRQHDNNTVGLKGGIKSKIRQAMRYINVFEIKKQTQNLYDNYAQSMTPEYKDLAEKICSYDSSFGNWIKMLFCKDFDFKNTSLNIIVRIKILLKKL